MQQFTPTNTRTGSFTFGPTPVTVTTAKPAMAKTLGAPLTGAPMTYTSSNPTSSVTIQSPSPARVIGSGSITMPQTVPARAVSAKSDVPSYPTAAVATAAPMAPVKTAPTSNRALNKPKPQLDLSVFGLLFDKLDWNGNGIVEFDDICAAEELAREGNLSTLFFSLLKYADKTKSGAITKPMYEEYLDLVARTWYEMGYTQADIDQFAMVVEYLTKESISTKVTEMRNDISRDWQATQLPSGMTAYTHKETGETVNKIDMAKDKDRVKKLWAALKLGDEDELTVKLVLENIPPVKKYVPEILTDYSRMDKDGNLTLTKKEVEEYINPSLKAEYTLKELEKIWMHITGNSSNKEIATMEDVGNDIQYVDSSIPELKDEFLSICYGKSCTMKKPDFMAYFAAADLWLDERLKGIIGLEDLKQQVKSFYWGVRLNRLRRAGGHDVHSDEAIVLMFKGNPGVGKTTIGRIITKLLYKIEIIPEDKFMEVQRDQMVGAALGQTEQKTQKLIDDAAGGVLFVDEAYRLSSDQFGKEAVNCLMRAMTVKGHVIVVAGYPKEMDDWTLLNPGIKRRITYEFEFPNYAIPELSKILIGMVGKAGFTTDVPASQLETLIKRYTAREQLENFNGGVCEHVLRHAIESLNQREVSAVKEAAKNSVKPPCPSVKLSYQDFEYGCQHIPKVAPTV